MDGKEGGEKGRLMTRGQFLGTGAAAAAGMGLAGVAAAATADPSRAGPQQCGRACPPASFTWAIPAGVLNTLWSDIFPRLVAREWRAPGSTTVHPDMTVADLQTELSTLTGSADFQARVALVNAHFGSASHMPFRVSGRGGYDFLITDDGIEFFIPDRPGTVLELLRYYTFRNTGRPAIGLPFYLSHAISAVSIDSPTGPSQIHVDRDAILRRVEAAGAECIDLLCLRPRPGDGVPVRQIRDAVIGMDAYRCIIEGVTCWIIEGSVYRGMMTEIPRVVANAWIEAEIGTTGLPKSYASRIPDPLDAGLRSIFEERLETSLPRANKMHFELHPASPPPSMGWDVTDVMVTNKGFFFPLMPALPSTNALDVLLAEIEGGRAGNPVFTDSKRTMT